MNKKILIVDNDQAALNYLKHILENMGYDVSIAENRENAFLAFDMDGPPLALIAMDIPGVGGMEILKRIKGGNTDVEVIAVVDSSNMELGIESLENRASDFLIKPISVNALEVVLKRSLEKIDMKKNYEELKALNRNFMDVLKKKSWKLSEFDWVGDPSNVIKRVFSFFEDVAKDEEGGATISSESPFFLSIHDRNLRIIDANRASRNRLGICVGGRSWEIYEGEAGKKRGCPVYETFKNGYGARRKAIMKNGVPVVVRTAPIRDGNGRIALVLESYIEMSKVHQMKKRLWAIQRRYQILFDEAPCAISLQNKDLEIVAANRRFVQDFGDDIGAKCYQVYMCRDAQCECCAVMETFRDGKPHSMEKAGVSKFGKKYNILTSTGPVKNEQGEIIQVMEMSINITELHQLRDHMASIGLLIGSISHGMKNLLTSLDGGMYLVNSGFFKGDMNQVMDGWEDVKLVVNRIKSMIMDIIYYLKEREPERQPVNALKFANDVADTFELRLKKKKIDFIRDFDDSPGDLNIDTEITHTALMNILENAFQACAEMNSRKTHSIAFSMGADDENVIFQIVDNGVGMSRETVKNMFNLFFSSKGKHGTGVGLFMAQKMIEQHGGKIVVDSTPGKGSRFKIILPRYFDSAKTAPAPASKTPGRV